MLAALIPLLAPILDKVLGAVLPDPQAKAKAIADVLGLLQQSDLGQMEVNRQEAAHASMFVAGWRPFIGWCCGLALAYQFIAAPIAIWIGFVVGHPVPKPPTLDDNLWQLMFGMLGMGALRSFEKLKGVAR
jgi:hypothetical protein